LCWLRRPGSDHDVGGNVRDAHRGFDFVDVLAPLPPERKVSTRKSPGEC